MSRIGQRKVAVRRGGVTIAWISHKRLGNSPVWIGLYAATGEIFSAANEAAVRDWIAQRYQQRSGRTFSEEDRR